MKNHTPLIVATSLVSLFIGCATQHIKLPTPMSANPKITNLGIVEVADGVSSSHLLADGRTCIFKPAILTETHQIRLEASITHTNADGMRYVYSDAVFFTPDAATTFEFDSNNIINLTLHIKK